MIDLPQLSIIIPIYNAEHFLPALLRSVREQDFSDFECILINDGSTDDSKNICEKFADQDARFTVMTKVNGGVSEARNLGLEIARGEYIGFVDADDHIETDMYSTLLQGLQGSGAELASCGVVHEKEFQFLPPSKTPAVFQTYAEPIDYFYEDELAVDSLWNKVFHRSLLEGLKFCEDIDYTEDQLFLAEAMLNAHTMALTRAVKYHYLKHAGSLSASWGSFDFWGGHVRAMKRIYELVAASQAKESTKNKAFVKYGKSIFSLVRLAVQERRPDLYAQLKCKYREDVFRFFHLPGVDFAGQMTYRTYWLSYGLASLIHYYPKKI